MSVEQLSRVVEAQSENLKNLSSMLFEIEHRVGCSEEKIIRHDERLVKLQNGQDKISSLVRAVEGKINTMVSDIHSVQKDFSINIGEIHRLKTSVDNLNAMLQSHAQQETEQYNSYMEAITKNATIVALNTETLEKLNKNFIKLIVVSSVFIIAFSMMLSKFDLVSKLGLLGG